MEKVEGEWAAAAQAWPTLTSVPGDERPGASEHGLHLAAFVTQVEEKHPLGSAATRQLVRWLVVPIEEGMRRPARGGNETTNSRKRD